MKKLLSLLLVLAMLPLSVSLAQEERMLGVYQMPEDIRETAHINSLISLNDALYALAEGDIYVLNKGDKEFSLYAKKAKKAEEGSDYPERLSHLLTDGQKMYGFNASKGLFATVENDNGTIGLKDEKKLDISNHIISFDIGDGEEQEFPDYPQALALVGDKLCAMYYMQDTGGIMLSAFDLETGEEEVYDDIQNVQAFSPYKEGKLLLTVRDYANPDDKGAMLKTLDIQSGEVEEIGLAIKDEGNNGRFYGSVLYYPEGDFIFYINESNVMKRNEDGTAERVSYMPSVFYHSGETGRIETLSQNRFAYVSGSVVRIISLDPKDLPTKNINILGYIYSQSHEKTLEKMPDIAVKILEQDGSMSEMLSKALVSGGMDIDIIVPSATNMDIKSLIEKGYALDLSDIEGVREYYDSLYPYYKEINPQDGKIYALPVQVYFNNFSYNPELLEKLGLEKPETFEDFCDVMKWWYENPNLTEEYKFYAMPEIKQAVWGVLFETYMAFMRVSGQELKFDTPEFRSMVEKLNASLELVPKQSDTMSDEDYIEFYESPTLFGKQSLDIYDIKFYNERQRRIEDYKDIDGEYYIETYPSYPIKFKVKADVPAAISATSSYIMINSQGKNAETAKEYIKANIASQDFREKISYLADFNEIVENPYYEKSLEYIQEAMKSVEKDLAEKEGAEKTEGEKHLALIKTTYEEMLAGEGKYEYTQEDLDVVQSFLKDVYLESYENGLLNRGEIHTLVTRLIDGQMDTEAFIKEMDGKIKLIRLENQ
ncbi:MAG: ABC transporter substrate-binding protein [Eubacteriales bacterium]|nr:ABC transporter substrate-binding protein [Eubacteriales bacterium]